MNKNKWIRTGIIITVVILSIWISSVVLEHVTIHQVYSYYVDSIHRLTGLNKYLIKAAVLLLIIPFIFGLKLYFFSPFKKKYRYTGAAILIAIMILYNLSLYYFTRSSYFAFSEGKVLKWYAETPEGIRFFDAPGFDPKYGTKLKQATPEIIANLERKNRGMQPKPVAYHSIQEIEFFDSITREPKVWYYLNPSGVYELFDNPGVHPTYGEPLVPITQHVVLLIKSKYDEDIPRRQEETRKLEEQKAAQERVAFLRKQEQAKKTKHEFEKLITEKTFNTNWHIKDEWKQLIANKKIIVIYSKKSLYIAAEIVQRLRSLGATVSYDIASEVSFDGQPGNIYYQFNDFDVVTAIQAAVTDIESFRLTSTGFRGQLLIWN